jgi:hypothetical protein
MPQKTIILERILKIMCEEADTINLTQNIFSDVLLNLVLLTLGMLKVFEIAAANTRQRSLKTTLLPGVR